MIGKDHSYDHINLSFIDRFQHDFFPRKRCIDRLLFTSEINKQKKKQGH